MPDSVVLAVALKQGIACGCGCGRHIFKLEDLKRDHHPPLALREYNPKTRKYTPDANDPKFITLYLTEHHDIKTNGGPQAATTAGTDIGNIRKAARLMKKNADFKAKMLAKTFGTPIQGKEED
jgi:hypothetical protein